MVKPMDNQRSKDWPKVRRAFLKKHPRCANCNGDKKLEVHHIKVFHLNKELELDPTNFIVLCENKKDGVNCHLLVGHLGSFRSWNENVRQDAEVWNQKITKRP